MLLNTRIGISLMSIFGALALLGGAAFALFTDTATVSGLTVSAGNADVKIRFTGSLPYADNIPTSMSLTDLYPGQNDITPVSIDVQNASISPIDLKLKGTFSAPQVPNCLSHAIVVEATGTGGTTGEKTLAEWSAGVDLPSAPIAQGLNETYSFNIRVLTNYNSTGAGCAEAVPGNPVGSEIASNGPLDPTSLIFTGTQVTP